MLQTTNGDFGARRAPSFPAEGGGDARPPAAPADGGGKVAKHQRGSAEPSSAAPPPAHRTQPYGQTHPSSSSGLQSTPNAPDSASTVCFLPKGGHPLRQGGELKAPSSRRAPIRSDGQNKTPISGEQSPKSFGSVTALGQHLSFLQRKQRWQ